MTKKKTTKKKARKRQPKAKPKPKSYLNQMQQAFVREYLIDLNATKAAVRAGYSKKTANKQGPRLLVNVGIQVAIQRAMDARAIRVGLKADDVLNEVSKAAMAEIGKPATWDQKLRALELSMKHLKLLGGDEAVQALHTTEELAQTLRCLMAQGWKPPNKMVKKPEKKGN